MCNVLIATIILYEYNTRRHMCTMCTTRDQHTAACFHLKNLESFVIIFNFYMSFDKILGLHFLRLFTRPFAVYIKFRSQIIWVSIPYIRHWLSCTDLIGNRINLYANRSANSLSALLKKLHLEVLLNWNAEKMKKSRCS